MLLLLTLLTQLTFARPERYTELVDYVIQAPDQGETATCLFMGSTGAMEILLNKKHNLRDQRPGDRFDLAEQFLIHQREWTTSKHRFENQLLKFNWGEAVHASHIPFEARLPDGTVNNSVWRRPAGFATLPRIKVPKVETERLFVKGRNRWSTFVLSTQDIETIKQALWKHKTPVLVNYNDEFFWHVITIVGYDDTTQDAPCYDTPQVECDKNAQGAFYIRDSFGVPVEIRDTDWFRVKGNAAFVTRLVEP